MRVRIEGGTRDGRVWEQEHPPVDQTFRVPPLITEGSVADGDEVYVLVDAVDPDGTAVFRLVQP